MTRPNPLLRWITGAQIALLAWTWAVPLAARGQCPHGAASAAAASHLGHGQSGPGERSPSRHPGPCDCVGHCNAGRAPLLPSIAALPEPAAVAAVEAEPLAPPPGPRAAPHLAHLPFSTAPPVA